MVSAAYVRDLPASRVFYQAVGFEELSAGSNDLSAWSSMRYGRHSIVLVTSDPAPDIPTLPLLFYFFVDDLDATTGALRDAGYPVTHVGYPPHAPGGELKTVDPDGNTILFGQPERSDTARPPGDDPAQRFSLLREAAALARQRAAPPATCQVGDGQGGPCERPAEVKLADGWGDSVWACLPHAEDTLIAARSVFIASQDEDDGLARFLAGRGRHAS
jgi:catechol 2,3-dioxygenase-like lactoylglutathione lyase family enzyme